jgi:hypothetical protein
MWWEFIVSGWKIRGGGGGGSFLLQVSIKLQVTFM